MRARFIDFPKYSCIIGRIWLTLAKSLESVVFIEKAANFSLKLLIFKDCCKYNLLIIKCLTIEFYFLSSTKLYHNILIGLTFSSPRHIFALSKVLAAIRQNLLENTLTNEVCEEDFPHSRICCLLQANRYLCEKYPQWPC